MRTLTVAITLTVAATACSGARQPSQPARPGHYLYVTDAERGEVAGYHLDEASGKLSPIGDHAFVQDRLGAKQLALSPDGTFGFIGTSVGTMPVTLAADGAMTLEAGDGLPGSAGLAVIHPSGRFLYSSGAAGLDVHLLTKGVAGKDLVAHYPISAREVSIDDAGRQLFAVNSDDTSFSVFDIDGASGRLTEAPGSPVVPLDRTDVARPHPNGLLYFALTHGTSGAHMHVFLRAPDGFSPVIGSPFALADDAQSFTITRDGRYLFVTLKMARAVAAYAIDDAGGIHPAPGSPFSVAQAPDLVEPDPGGRFLYVTHPGPGTVAVYSIAQNTGALVLIPGSGTRPSLHPYPIAWAIPAVPVDVASLPAPDSPNLQPIETVVAPSPATMASASAAASAPATRTDVSERPKTKSVETAAVPTSLPGLKLSCQVPSSGSGIASPQGTIVSNLERIPLSVTMEGPRNVRSVMLSVKKDGFQEGDTVEVELAAFPGQQPPKPVPIRVSTIVTPEDTDATVTHMSLMVEIPQAETYVAKAVDEYITSMLYARGTDAVSKDPALRSIQNNRSSAAATLKSVFMENQIGTYDVYCTFHLKAAPLEKNLVAKTRVQVAYRGKFFDQHTYPLR